MQTLKLRPLCNKKLLSTDTYSNKLLNPYYVTGFSDGEVCFYVAISPEAKTATGYRIKISFHIGLHQKDLVLLELIKCFFGIGNITKLGQESILYRVSSIEDLKVIIGHFYKYPLITYKCTDYLLFKQVFELIEKRYI